MIPFYLVTGYLGSGKTTFLQNVLNENSHHIRIAIIQNEFAPTGFDGKELKKVGEDFKLLEINNGSVFCVCMMGNFLQSLERLILDYSPDAIFLEASGLSDPINIIELLQNDSIRKKVTLAHIFTLIDVPNFIRVFQAIKRVKHQIMVADTVVLNKIDLFSGDLLPIKKEIQRLNPFAELQETNFAEIPFSFHPAQEHKHTSAKRFKGIVSEGRPDLHVCVLRTHEKIRDEELHRFICELQETCYRIKGYLNVSDGSVAAVQAVFGDLNIGRIEGYQGPSELITFSDSLDLKSLRQLFKKYV